MTAGVDSTSWDCADLRVSKTFHNYKWATSFTTFQSGLSSANIFGAGFAQWGREFGEGRVPFHMVAEQACLVVVALLTVYVLLRLLRLPVSTTTLTGNGPRDRAICQRANFGTLKVYGKTQ